MTTEPATIEDLGRQAAEAAGLEPDSDSALAYALGYVAGARALLAGSYEAAARRQQDRFTADLVGNLTLAASARRREPRP